MSYFAPLILLPADPLLGLMAAARRDPRPETLDVGVGVYRDEHGNTPIMAAVHEAQTRLVREQKTKAYEGQRGNEAFCDSIETLCLGQAAHTRYAQRLTSTATPGGTAAVWAAMMTVRRARPEARVWLPRPSWANHRHIAQCAGFETEQYDYIDPASRCVGFARILEALAQAKNGDAVILQGPCHNPTGADLNAGQWSELGRALAARDMIPIIDIAYHGLGMPLEHDLAGVRSLVELVPECIVCYSCSKNFGLYRDRVGALLIVADSGKQRDIVASHVASLTRAVYSMPPAHGAALVDMILRDPQLCTQWSDELAHMRTRLSALRGLARAALEEAGQAAAFLTQHTGMFSILPLADGAPATLREQHAMYLPQSGRINVAALGDDTVVRFAQAVAPLMAPQ